jgi:alkanesulfonate monooxygenase SsuD/methylene tetrahydromethanopterin reductase-like flavin-dependent oxidoreductase (luciferase family)
MTMIETWGFYFFGQPPEDGVELVEADYQRIFDQYVDLWVRCESWGFDGVTWAEHHFNPGTLSPSPNLLVAAVAARTTKLRFTILGTVLPMNNVRRYAEECGMLHYLTHGRFEPGIGPGAGAAEAIRDGMTWEEVRPRYYSGAELLGKAIAGKRVTHQDEFYNLDNVPLEPPIYLGPGQSVWTTVLSPDSAAWAAERGFKIATAWHPVDKAAAVADRYYEAADAAGVRVDPSMVGLRRRVFVAETDALAQKMWEESVDLVGAHAGSMFETQDPAIFKMFDIPDDFAIGSPETVAERLIEQCQAGGFGTVFAFTDFGGFTPEQLARSHELIGTKVAPLLRSADVKGGSRGTDVDLHELAEANAAHFRSVDADRT